MDIALFTNGTKSIAGTSNGQSFFFDSMLIFQDPDLFTKRFLYLLEKSLNISDISEIERIIISLTGLIDTEKNKILKSYLLNDVSRIKIYNGFNFNDALMEYFNKEQIFVVNDAFATALGISQKKNNYPLPCMVLSMDDGVGVSFINNSNSIITTEWGGDFVPSMGKSIYQALGKESIYSLLLSKKVNIYQDYTEYLIHAIKYLSQKYEQDNSSIQSIIILGEKSQYVDEKQLATELNNYQVSVIKDEIQRKDIILSGCFSYPLFSKNQKNKVVKILYLSGQELIYDFEDFQKCIKHFISVKPISNPDNYYKIFYADGAIKSFTIGSLNDVSELEFYSF